LKATLKRPISSSIYIGQALEKLLLSISFARHNQPAL